MKVSASTSASPNSHASVVPKSIFTVDVEDWFHILDLDSTPDMRDWDALPSTVERNFRKLLDLFARHGVSTTCFFLGWVAERYPHLVREASSQGHEVASHGYSHGLVFRGSPEQFLADISRSKDVLEQISGQRVLGYRAPGFSVTEQTPWFFDQLAEAGYQYDSSVFPARRGHGGMAGARRAPHAIRTRSGASVVEFPISVVDLFSARVCLFGGGYLRLFPWWLTRAAARRVQQQGQSVIYYVHPRELDPEQQRLPMNLARKFKSYVNLHTTQRKVESILREFEFVTFREYLGEFSEASVLPRKVAATAAAAVRTVAGGNV